MWTLTVSVPTGAVTGSVTLVATGPGEGSAVTVSAGGVAPLTEIA